MYRAERKVQNYIWRAALSVFVALVLFVHAPLEVHAAGITCTLTSSPSVEVPLSYLSYLSNGYTGASYSGAYTANLKILLTSSQVGHYLKGYLVFPIFFDIASYDLPSNGYYLNGFSVFLENAETPDGMSVSFHSVVTDGTLRPIWGQLYISFDNLVADRGDFYLSLTFGIRCGAHGTKLSITSLTSMTVNVTSGTVADYVNVVDPWYTKDPFTAWYYTAIQNIKGQLNNIFTAIQNQTDQIRISLDAVNKSINTQGKNITDKIQSQITNDNSNTTKIINSANTNSQNEINAANKNSQNEIAAANKNADDIMHDYDTTTQDSDNKKFDEAQKELQEVEDNLFGQAVSGFGSLDMSDFTIGKFSAVLPAFSFVSNFIQSLYVKMGDFGTIVTVGLVVMIATKVIGLYRFSTGGDG